MCEIRYCDVVPLSLNRLSSDGAIHDAVDMQNSHLCTGYFTGVSRPLHTHNSLM